MSELRDLARKKIVADLFGDEWSPSRPWDMGGIVGHMMAGSHPTESHYRQSVGRIQGMMAMLDIIDEAEREINGEIG